MESRERSMNGRLERLFLFSLTGMFSLLLFRELEKKVFQLIWRKLNEKLMNCIRQERRNGELMSPSLIIFLLFVAFLNSEPHSMNM